MTKSLATKRSFIVTVQSDFHFSTREVGPLMQRTLNRYRASMGLPLATRIKVKQKYESRQESRTPASSAATDRAGIRLVK